MGSKVKVGILEKDGVELYQNTELPLRAEFVEIKPPINGFDDVDAFLRDGITDHHAGWYDIISAQVVEILDRKQMRVQGPLTISGTLTINGILVLD